MKNIINESIQFVSDIHLEFRKKGWNWEDVIKPSAPYLILAGDICQPNLMILEKFYYWCSRNFKATIHIPGNHEYWSNRKGEERSIHYTNVQLQELCNKYGIIFGQKKTIILPGLPPIITCTLWCNPDPHSIKRNDYRYIKNFNPQKEKLLNEDHIAFIENEMSKYQQKCIVVTHHAPLREGTMRQEFEGDELSNSYTNDLPHLVDRSLCWIFGHTHHVCDIVRDSGTIVCSNPIGYSREKLPYDVSAILTFT